jgi:hypothetical protein
VCCVYTTATVATKTNPPKKKKKKREFCASIIATTVCVLCLRYHCCYHKNKPTKKKKKEFCASIIAATKWLWSSFIAAATTPTIAIHAATLVVVNRWMTEWMKCPSGWMTVRVD